MKAPTAVARRARRAACAGSPVAVAAEADSLAPAERVALLAWLAAFRHHWPMRFAETLGDDGVRLITTLQATPVDPNQYLKLRRIAVANLAAHC